MAPKVDCMSEPDYYRFVACPNPECLLRFPGVEAVACPLCKTKTLWVADRCQAPSVSKSTQPQGVSLLLDNVRSVFNVGSIFRSADGCGIEEIFLCGISPTPEHPAMRKTALGAEKTISWQHDNNSLRLAHKLIEEGRELWALEHTKDSIDVLSLELELAPKLVLVLGNEVTGVDPGLLQLCEHTLHIPMRGEKASLNVATAAGIAGYALCQKGECASKA